MLEDLPLIPTLIGAIVLITVLAVWAPGFLALAVLSIFLSVMIWHVPSPDMTAILVIVVAMAAWDFYREYRRKRAAGNGNGNGSGSGNGSGTGEG